MPEFILKNKESVDEDIKRIINYLIDTAISCLENELDNDFDEAIHTVRKSLKKIRSVLRLIRDDIGTDNYRKENAFFRDINRNMAEIRGVTAIIDILNKLNSDKTVNYKPLIDNFIELKEKIIIKLCLEENRLEKVVELLRKGKERIERIVIKNKEYEILFLGFVRIFNQCLRNTVLAKNELSTENLHEWRKRVKYLYYQFQVLEPVLPGDLLAYVPKLDKLADYLGEDHDLAELGSTLSRYPHITAGSNDFNSIYSKIDEARYDMYKTLFSLAGEIFDEKLRTGINNLVTL